MKKSVQFLSDSIKDRALVWIVLLLGIGLVGSRMFGPQFELIPGDLGDTRFNNYILEHFFRWLSGMEHSFWTAPFFYPFSDTIAFGDNLLGSAPFYAVFRWVGLDRESAFQGWFLIGIVLNYLSAAVVLSRLNLKPLAAAAGAFFFAFGLPILAQENHPQLFYRFGIPLACFWLWNFAKEPRLKFLAGLTLAVVWQFFLSIYLGVFLALLLVVMVVLLPFFTRLPSWRGVLLFWPEALKEAWLSARPPTRILVIAVAAGLVGALLALFQTYRAVSIHYGFQRSWDVIATMLPRWRSYLMADNSLLWKPISDQITGLPARWEHQLFPGIAMACLLGVGIFCLNRSAQRRIAWLNLTAVALLVLFTLSVRGFSLYRAILNVPGINSIRTVTRIELALIWPLAVYAGCTLDALLRASKQRINLASLAALSLVALLFAESFYYKHVTFLKADTQARIAELRGRIPESIPDQPVLFLAANGTDPFWAVETDAMLLAQELGWPTLNGYSGNYPPGYKPPYSCERASQHISAYMKFARISDPAFSAEVLGRIVPVGFGDCRFTPDLGSE